MNIYVFGNPLVPEDAAAVGILPTLQHTLPSVQFIHTDPTDNWWENNRHPLLIDCVKGLQHVTVFTSLEAFQIPHYRMTPHDYDLSMDLALLLKLGKIDGFTLIGIPQKQNNEAIVNDVIGAIKMNTVRSAT